MKTLGYPPKLILRARLTSLKNYHHCCFREKFLVSFCALFIVVIPVCALCVLSLSLSLYPSRRQTRPNVVREILKTFSFSPICFRKGDIDDDDDAFADDDD